MSNTSLSKGLENRIKILSYLMENGWATETILLKKLKFQSYQILDYYIDTLVKEGVVVRKGKYIYPSKFISDTELVYDLFNFIKKYALKYSGEYNQLINSIFYSICVLIDDV